MPAIRTTKQCHGQYQVQLHCAVSMALLLGCVQNHFLFTHCTLNSKLRF